MDKAKLRAWWFHKQGLDGSLRDCSVEKILERTGWSRSVGGANPYLALHARAGFTREQIDSAVADLSIHELPSARGCTYILPSVHFALGLVMGQGFGEATEINIAVKHLGVTLDEIDRLAAAIVDSVAKQAKDPRQLREDLGAQVRNLGEAGKKRGVTTTLPLALGALQSQGRIRRVPMNGRLDQQRYAYVAWSHSPLSLSALTKQEAAKNLAMLYFSWIGPASIKGFQWFSGLGVTAAKEAVASLPLVPTEPASSELILESDKAAFDAFQTPARPAYALVGGLDNVTHLRLGLPDLVDAEDHAATVPTEKAIVEVGRISELASHGIYDRGRLIGVWEFDPEAGEIVAKTWRPADPELRQKIAETEAFVRDDLTDARSFSLDSPESRKPRLAALRA
ncbi:MAG: winged helix DNA-binding domain-containing protein [Armatimonadetes bacterium]|nr:winged helix DNA-binding domain-containing protein [Armatimonadota bacterium]